ncbi:hypothetical protein VNO77_16166 [Canavalia gladiata]|uniref:Uncharacterized protein n=1 Tax=Canavalia gladiata TaxID=3824 RepID=A0AAN9QSV8_CANGL
MRAQDQYKRDEEEGKRKGNQNGSVALAHIIGTIMASDWPRQLIFLDKSQILLFPININTHTAPIIKVFICWNYCHYFNFSF